MKKAPSILGVRVYPYTSQVNLNVQIDTLRTAFIKKYQKGLPPSPDYPVRDFNIIQVLGHGGFGNVYLVKERSHNDCYALKVQEKEAIMRQQNLKQIITEKSILGCMNFPFLLNMYKSFKDPSRIYFLLPFCNGGDLHQLLNKLKRFREGLACFYAAQILLALEFLHRCGIVYRDLKTENILIERNGYIKVMDFGFTKIISGRTYSFCGTPEYMSPEMILNKGHGFACDWWSFGVLVFEMVNGATPFYARFHGEIFENIIGGKFTIPEFFSDALSDLTNRILQADPTKRLGNLKGQVGDIKDHLWFQYIHFSEIYKKTLRPPYVPDLKDQCDASLFKVKKKQAEALDIGFSIKENVYVEEFKKF